MPYESYIVVTKTINGKNIGVSVADVRAALGVSDGDFAALCKHLKVSKWNIYRPIRVAQREAVTLQQRKNLHYGLSFPWTYGTNMGEAAFEAIHPYGTAEYSTELERKYANRHWEDNKPAGGSSTPYRISDFAVKVNDATDPQGSNATRKGYHTIAPRPVTIDHSTQGLDELPDGSWEVNVAAANTLTFTFRNTITSVGGMGISDIAVGYRAYIQLYEDKRVTQNNVWKEWYELNPVQTAIGQDLITDNTASVTVVLPCPLPSSTPFYIVFGFIKSDAQGNITAADEYCFLAPYDESERRQNPSFIKHVFFRNHSTRNVRLAGVTCYTNKNNWMIDGGGVWYMIQGGGMRENILTYKLEINGGNIAYRLVKANSSESPTASRHLMQLIVVDRNHATSDSDITNNGTILTPGTISDGVFSPADYVDVVNNNPDVYTAFYAQGGERPGISVSDEVKYYIMYMRTRTNGSVSWSPWTEVNTVYVWDKIYPY